MYSCHIQEMKYKTSVKFEFQMIFNASMAHVLFD